jgi:hypothetical protein
MNEENLVPSEETEIPQEEVLDTTEESEEASQPDSEAHEEEPEEAINFERLQKKSQQLESQNSQYQKQLQTYGEWLLKDEGRTTDYLKSQGLDEQQVTDALNRIRESRPGIWEKKEEGVKVEDGQKKPDVPIDINKIKKEIRDEMTLDQYVKQSQLEFMEAVPEMNPKNYMDASPEDRQLVAEFADKVDFLAKALMKVQPLSYKDALVSSYNTLLAQLQGGRGSEKEEGYLEGLAEKNADNATSFGEMSGEPAKAVSANLSQQERSMAAKLGMTEQEYAKYKR